LLNYFDDTLSVNGQELLVIHFIHDILKCN
jgi:hypothetical protein